MRLPLVAVGGTFDHFHKGHEALLLRAFELGERVIVGVTSENLAKKLGKKEIQDFNQRFGQVKAFLIVNNLIDRAKLIQLDDVFGPLSSDPEISGVVVTQETLRTAEEANRIRVERGLPPLKILLQNYVLAADGKPISSTRIRNKEIDARGYLINKQ